MLYQDESEPNDAILPQTSLISCIFGPSAIKHTCPRRLNFLTELQIRENGKKMTPRICCFHIYYFDIGLKWTRYLSRYGDWLWAARSGDRIPVGARFSVPVKTGPGAHSASCTMGTGYFPGVESGRVVTLTPHPLLVPGSKNRVQLYLYSPYGPWPVKRVKPTYIGLKRA
jgi:hypothetical protein